MQRHEINVVEVAEPMSAQEAMERDLADDAGSRAYDYQVALNDVVPHALLNWPKRDDGTLLYEREEQFSLVRNLLVDAVFAKVAGRRGVLLDSVPEAIEVSSSLMRPCEYWRQDEPESGDAQVLTASEREALELLFEERRRHAERWTEMHTSMDTAREFKLLHLSWALRVDGYEVQWEKFRKEFLTWRSGDLGKHILSDDTLSRLWQFHAVSIDGASGALASLSEWHATSLEERKTGSDLLSLRTLS